MSEMVERVRAAIAKAQQPGDDPACAAILALFEPTGDMLAEGLRAMATYQGTPAEVARMDLIVKWQAMIRAAVR